MHNYDNKNSNACLLLGSSRFSCFKALSRVNLIGLIIGFKLNKYSNISYNLGISGISIESLEFYLLTLAIYALYKLSLKILFSKIGSASTAFFREY